MGQPFSANFDVLCVFLFFSGYAEIKQKQKPNQPRRRAGARRVCAAASGSSWPRTACATTSTTPSSAAAAGATSTRPTAIPSATVPSAPTRSPDPPTPASASSLAVRYPFKSSLVRLG